ncbi:hypothetical protein SOHN41_02023 [Shewanella sp. HN-41]|nr:hypothetical protein SOHN41_02023 [Shewanella sp. HN-41]
MREIAHQIITRWVIAEKAAKFSVVLGQKPRHSCQTKRIKGTIRKTFCTTAQVNP